MPRQSSYFSKITSREECYTMLQIVPGLLLVGNLRFVLLVDLSFSVLHFSSVVFQSRLTFVQLGCFFFWQWLLSFLSVLSDWLVARGRASALNARRRARQSFRDYPNCLLLLLLLLVPKQYEEVRDGLSVSEGGSQC